MKIAFVSYTYQPLFETPEKWVQKIHRMASVMECLAKKATVTYIRNLNYSGEYVYNGVTYLYPLAITRKSYFPLGLNSRIKELQPDVVMVIGLRSPIQIILLRRILGKKTIILARNQAEPPPVGIRKILQRMADWSIDSYHFTSIGNAEEWLDAGIISDRSRILEITDASTNFVRLNKEQCRLQLGIGSVMNYIWAGRLEKNKDPLTVINGFAKYLTQYPEAKLHMIFQEDDLLPVIKKRLAESEVLRKAVLLHGYIPYEQLPVWYSAADFFISGSHREGGSYALLEAMSCGCIPIVTAIPPAIKVTGEGKYGFYYEAGNAEQLFEKLSETRHIDIEAFSKKLEQYFIRELSPSAIARQFYETCASMLAK